MLRGFTLAACAALASSQQDCAGNIVVAGKDLAGEYVPGQGWGGQRSYINPSTGVHVYHIAASKAWFMSQVLGVRDAPGRVRARRPGVPLIGKGTWDGNVGGNFKPDPYVKVSCAGDGAMYAASDAPAKSIVVYGREGHNDDMNGVYNYEPRDSHGMPCYKKDDMHWLSLNGVNQWIIGTEKDIGSQRALAFLDAPNAATEPPYEVTGMVWQVSQADGQWARDPSVQLVRGNDRAVHLHGRDGINSNINGVYTGVNVKGKTRHAFGRVVYEQEAPGVASPGSTPMFMYYHTVNDGRWIVGRQEDVGTDRGVAWYADEYGDDPVSAAKWNVVDGDGRWSIDPRVRVTYA